MNLIAILVALVILGGVLYVLQLLPIDETVKRIGYVVAIVGTAVWVLQSLGSLVHSAP